MPPSRAAADVDPQRCTDLRARAAGGTVCALGTDTPYGSIAPQVTAICEDVLAPPKAENLPPIIARQPALYEDKRRWREIEAEVAAVRAENAAARVRLGAPPAGMAL